MSSQRTGSSYKSNTPFAAAVNAVNALSAAPDAAITAAGKANT